MLMIGPLHGQTGAAVKAAREVIEAIGKKGGREGLEEVAHLGGERAVREVMERAYAEGGEELVNQLVRHSDTYGAGILHGARRSPARFAEAFEQVPEELKSAAVHAIQREPELMAGLIMRHGDHALLAGARHPGVGPRALSAFGDDAAELLPKLTTDQVIRLNRLAPEIANAAPARKAELLDLIGQAPKRVLDLLEEHPKVLLTGAGLSAFLLAKDQILGGDEIIIGPDGVPRVVSKPGVAGRAMETGRETLNDFRRPIGYLLGVVGLGLAGWVGARIWRTILLSRIKIRAVEKEAREQARSVGPTEHSDR